MELIEALVLFNLIFTFILFVSIAYAIHKTRLLWDLITTFKEHAMATRTGQGPQREEQHVMTPGGPMPLSEFKASTKEENAPAKDNMFG